MSIAEQPEDWTEPGAWPVAAGVHRIPLPIPATGLHAVNAYVIEDAEGLVIVDSGWAMPDTEQALRTALRTLGHGLDDVRRVLVTHAHWDHYSQALKLREMFGSRVLIGRGERISIEAFNFDAGLHRAQVDLLRRAGAAELAEVIAAASVTNGDRSMPYGLPDAWLDDRVYVAVRGRDLEVIETPGHTRGHIVLRDAGAGLLFAGDHILPHISPSLGLEPAPEPKPLRSFLASLALVKEFPDTLLLPAHGPVTSSVHTRVDELVKHHEVRLDAAAQEVVAGSGTAFEVARALPWTRRQQKLNELEPFSQMLAVLEIETHLDLLADQGVLVAVEQNGVRNYAPAS